MKIEKIISIEATLKCVSGLHIGGSDTLMHIGGIDNTVIKNFVNGVPEPYIPGSSLKGKLRSLMEWRSGKVQEKPLSFEDYKRDKDDNVLKVLQLFGTGGSDKLSKDEVLKLGPVRLSFWDCAIEEKWVKDARARNQLLTESKSENVINRITGTAEHPRNTERVLAGTPFSFKLSVKVLDTDDQQELLKLVFSALKLLELDSLGGSGSRGYGKVRFENITVDGVEFQSEYVAVKPFE